MRTRILVFVALVLLLPACTIQAVRDTIEDAAGSEEQGDVDLEQSDEAAPASPLAEIVEEAVPSVVNVKVLTSGGRGEGSGVVIDGGGIILTNFHVVECSVNVRVVFNDGIHDEMTGTVVGGIPASDLAVIRVDANDLVPIEIGRSSRLRLGDEVLAIGFPLGLGSSASVTAGIVSALDRRISAGGANGETRDLEGLLQTDAAINPGNSGGALIDRAGRLVGINTAAAQASAAENIGFAIAIDSALPTVEEILSKRPEDRAWLGVSVDSIDTSFEASELGLDGDVRGAGIAQTFPGDPAEKAGIETGDVIVEIEGEPIRSGGDLTESLQGFEPGDEIEVVVVNPEGTREVSVTLGTRPPENVLEC